MEHKELEKELINITTQLLSETGEFYKHDIRMSDSLQDQLAIDSLSRAELFNRIEKKFSQKLPDTLLAKAETLNDIAQFLQQSKSEQIVSTKKIILTDHGIKSETNPKLANSLVDLLLLYNEHSPNKPHLYFQNENGTEEIVTYGELWQASLRVACGLKNLGLKKRETVAIMQPTQLGFFYTFLGTLLAGGIPVPIYPPFRTYMLETYAKTEAKILKSAEVRILVTFEQAETLSRLLKAFVPSLKTVTTVTELIKSEKFDKFTKPASHDFAFIQYTSGSTNDPKGVLLSHANLLSNIQAYGKSIQVSPNDIVVSWLPLYHDFGLIGAWLGSLYHGVPLILMTPFSFLNHPERWLWAIHYHRGTISGAPNFAYDLCIRKIEPSRIEGLDLSSWRVAANGAEKVYPRTLQQFAEKFAPYGLKRTALMPVYGLAESTVGLTIPPIGREFRIDKIDRKQFENERKAQSTDDPNAMEFASCGSAIEGHEIRIVDDQDRILSDRHIGHLQFRGPSNMSCYFNNPEATRNILSTDGWLKSGDLAYIADNEVFITGRDKDLIIKSGRNIYPVEIEECVGHVAGVRQGCVTAFSVADTEQRNERLIVVAESREKNHTQLLDVKQNIKLAITATLDIVPDEIILVAPHIVPKTSSGKLQRSACKALYLQGKLNKTKIPPWLQMCKLALAYGLSRIGNSIKLLGQFIYTAYMALCLGLAFIPLYLTVLFASNKTADKAVRIFSKFAVKISFCRVSLLHADNLKKSAPVIFAVNHASYIDGLLMLTCLPANVYFVGKKELFFVPIIGRFMRKLNYLAVDRMDFSKGLNDTDRIKTALQQGYSIVIFPEGTFGYASGLRPFRLGAFKIAAETDTPIVPVALSGTRFILRDSEKILNPGAITITVCAPIKAHGTEWQDVIQFRKVVRDEIAKYCKEPSLDFIAAQTVASKIKES